MRQHKVWCVCLASCVERYAGLHSSIPLHKGRHAHTPNPMLQHHHNWPFTFLKNFKFSDFNKEPTSSLKMIWIMIETCWSVFKYFVVIFINPLNAGLNPICHLLALLGAHHILHVSRIRVNYKVLGYNIPSLCFFCTVHCDIITQHKPTKCTYSKLVFKILILMSSTCFEPEGSSSGRRLYMHVLVRYVAGRRVSCYCIYFI